MKQVGPDDAVTDLRREKMVLQTAIGNLADMGGKLIADDKMPTVGIDGAYPIPALPEYLFKPITGDAIKSVARIRFCKGGQIEVDLRRFLAGFIASQRDSNLCQIIFVRPTSADVFRQSRNKAF